MRVTRLHEGFAEPSPHTGSHAPIPNRACRPVDQRDAHGNDAAQPAGKVSWLNQQQPVLAFRGWCVLCWEVSWKSELASAALACLKRIIWCVLGSQLGKRGHTRATGHAGSPDDWLFSQCTGGAWHACCTHQGIVDSSPTLESSPLPCTLLLWFACSLLLGEDAPRPRSRQIGLTAAVVLVSLAVALAFPTAAEVSCLSLLVGCGCRKVLQTSCVCV